MPLIQYRYFQPADGRYHAPGPSPAEPPPVRMIYAGAIPAAPDESPQDVLARLVGRHAAPTRPDSGRARPAGTGDLLDLGEMGLWKVLPVGFQVLDSGKLRETAER